jgi:hypothetical protein
VGSDWRGRTLNSEEDAVRDFGTDTATHERPKGLTDLRHVRLFIAHGRGHSLRRSIGLRAMRNCVSRCCLSVYVFMRLLYALD